MESWPDAVSAFLLKHPPGDFARGELAWAPALPWLLIALAVAAAGAVAIVAVARLRSVNPLDRLVLGGVRVAVFLLLGACLLRPTLVLSRAIAQRNVLAVVIDDSRSMSVTDQEGASRTTAVQGTFGDTSAMMARLRERFAVRVFRAAAAASPITTTTALAGTGTRTDLGASLESVREALADVPLAGIVLVTDGSQNGATDLERELAALDARQIPVHTVGVGASSFPRDVGIDAVRLPASVLVGGEVAGDVLLRLRGVGGERLILTYETGGRLAGADTLTLPRDRELFTVPVRIMATTPGPTQVRVTASSITGEATAINNTAETMVRVQDGPRKVLYVEGEPRPELPFLRRALTSDSVLQVVALIRTAPGKFLRLGVDDSLELASGFPTRRQELFRYRAIILGSIEASFFTGEQLRMLQEFVALRGGGLLALGGRSALAEGGYAGTALDDVLPLAFDPTRRRAPDAAATMVSVRPTPAGREHPALAFPTRAGAAPPRWDSLPRLSVVNMAGRPRAGATVLLQGLAGAGEPIPLLTVQRFGRGAAGVFAVQDAWRWQLSAALPVDDRTHGALWQRLVRWTLDGVPDQVELDVLPATTAPGEPVSFRLRVSDSLFRPRDDARVQLRIDPPDADGFTIPLSPATDAPAGEYTGSWTPASEGTHRLEASAVLGADTLRAEALLISNRSHGDPGRVERDQALLERIASETGGRTYDISDVSRLPDDVLITRSGVTAQTASDLWDAPLVLILLVLLLGADWTWRRWRGLA